MAKYVKATGIANATEEGNATHGNNANATTLRLPSVEKMAIVTTANLVPEKTHIANVQNPTGERK